MTDQPDIPERSGEAFEGDERLTVLGRRLAPGEIAPPFELDMFEPSTGAVVRQQLSETAGRRRLLNAVNSLDTPVCARRVGSRRPAGSSLTTLWS